MLEEISELTDLLLTWKHKIGIIFISTKDKSYFVNVLMYDPSEKIDNKLKYNFQLRFHLYIDLVAPFASRLIILHNEIDS